MKNTKRFLATALIPALIPFSVWADDADTSVEKLDQNSNPSVETTTETKAKPSVDLVQKASELKDKLWQQALQKLREAKLKRKVNIPTIELAKGLNLGGKYEIESSPSIGGNYSGIDVWEVNLAAYPQLFGIDSLPAGVGVGFSMGRSVTFIQQFKTRKESLLRVPYDPVTKLPTKSEIFFKKKKNVFTGVEELALKPGDFVGYRAPMTFSLGKGFSTIAASHLGLSAGLSYAISGDFDVHVFVMNDNMVRVKIMASKAKSVGASVGVSLLGFSSIGEMVVSRLIDTQILQFYFNKSETDLFIADYIFNLNQPESRELYDRTLGSKLHTFSLDSIKQQVLAANPFADDTTVKNRLLADLSGINQISDTDQGKSTEDRRIIKLLNAHNETKSTSNGIKISLLKLIKGEDSNSKTNSKITIYAQDSDSVKAKFKLDGYGATTSFEYFIWGDKSIRTDSLLTQTDLNNNPIEFVGLQNSKINEDKLLRQKELTDIMDRFRKILPSSISDKLEYPNWSFKEGKVQNSFIQQDITFNSELFKLPVNVTEAKIREALLEIVNHYGRLKARPIGAKDYNTSEDKDPVMEAHQRGEYAKAYGYEIETKFGGEKNLIVDQEMLLIPQKLALALDNRYAYNDRFEAFDYLYQKIPLFNEISTLLLLKVIPKNYLEKIVIVRIAMSARGQTPLITDYPDTESFNTSNLFREILAQTGYINDKSYNLRHYIKEDGTPYTINEILIEKQKLNK